MNLEELAKQTSQTSNMQRYFLACIDEFGHEFKAFIGELCQQAYEQGWNDADNTGPFEDRGGAVS